MSATRRARAAALLSVLPRELVLSEDAIAELRGHLDCTRREVLQAVDDLAARLKVDVISRGDRVVVVKVEREDAA